MFKILGADGKEYGPVGVEELRRWVREGRAGGRTQVRAAGGTNWVLLQSLPEVADIFTAPVVPSESGVPPVVRTLALAMFVVAGVSALFLVVSVVTIVQYLQRPEAHLSPMVLVSWSIGGIALPIRILSGIGLLRRREWARKLAIAFAAVLLVFDCYGWVNTISSWAGRPEILRALLMSPMYLFSNLWHLVTTLFNVATVVVLLRADVKSWFAPQKSAGGV